LSAQPWFKIFAADYLLDPDVDALPREAEALLLRMWCICHREGSCPADLETLARKTQCSQEYVSKFKAECEQFFELREGRLYSLRMEEEKRRSEQARKNANKRFAKQSAEQMAEQAAEPRSDSDSDFDSDFVFKNPPPSKTTVSTLEENARAREAHRRPKYDRAVGDRIDWRKYCAAREQVQLKLNHGARMSAAEILQEQCALSGISTERALDLERQMLALPPGASA
jgi:uncharacterized protein YdaU (DUF1376 family)